MSAILHKLKVVAGSLTALAAGFLPTPAAAGVNEWTSQGPFGGDVQVLLAVASSDRSVLYAGTGDGRVFRSDDRGRSWQPAHDGLAGGDAAFGGGGVRALAQDPRDPSTLYASTDAGVWKSTDAGRLWQASGDGLPEPADGNTAEALVPHPDVPGRVYAGIRGSGVFQSSDGGASWQPMDGSPDVVLDLALVPPALPSAAPDTLYAATDDGVWKSTDGVTWLAASPDLTGRQIVQLLVAPRDPSILFAMSRGGFSAALWKSVDGGMTWSELSFAASRFAVALALDPEDSEVVYAATNSNADVFRSSDGGATWSEGSDGITARVLGAVAVDSLRPEVIYVGTLSDGGVFKSTDSGASFSASNEGLVATEVPDLAIDPEMPSTIYAATNAGLFRSFDGGAGWTLLDFGFVLPVPIESLAVDPQDPATVYAGGGSGSGGPSFFAQGLFKTRDRGETWESVTDSFLVGSFADLEIDPVTPSTLYAVTSGEGLAKSTDSGSTWTPIGEGLPSEFVLDVALAPSAPSTLYAATIDFGLNGRVSKSTDGGMSWSPATSGLPGDFIVALAVDPSSASIVYAAGLGGVFRSSDGGASWNGTGLTSEIGLAVAIDPVTTSTLFASTLQGVAKSLDGGVSWQPVGGELQIPILALEIEPSERKTVFGATQGGGVVDLTQDAHCVADATTLCIDDEPGDRRFSVSLAFDTELGGGRSGDALATPLADLGISRGGILSFFDVKNPEVLVKVLDGCGVTDRFWVFYAATTTVGFTMTVTDTWTGDRRTYVNPDKMAAVPVTDTAAFATCGATGDGSAAAPPPLSLSRVLLSGYEKRPFAASLVTAEAGEPCVDATTTLCIDDEEGDARFRITAAFDTELGGGRSGDALATPLGSLGIRRGGVLSFFDPKNPEVLVKVLDGCASNGHFWVFAAATTTAGFTLTVDDTRAGVRQVIENPDRTAAVPVADVTAFATCDEGSGLVIPSAASTHDSTSRRDPHGKNHR